jgi:hypothetical protein
LSHLELKKARELSNMLDSWRKKVNAVMPPPNPKYNPNGNWPVPAGIL